MVEIVATEETVHIKYVILASVKPCTDSGLRTSFLGQQSLLDCVIFISASVNKNGTFIYELGETIFECNL